MKKNDVFTFTAPNGVEVTGVALHSFAVLADEDILLGHQWVCYAQNRLFSMMVWSSDGTITNIEVIVDYAILPDYDEQLALYQAMEYPLWEQIAETPDPDESEDAFWNSCAEEHNKQEDV